MSEHATREHWSSAGEDKSSAVKRMFAEISPTYDLMNSAMSLRLHHRWRREAVRMLRLSPGESALDVCCGTGDFAAPLRAAIGTSGRVVGVDFCLPMLEKGVAKRVPMTLLTGDAGHLPIRSSAFDAVTVGWGLRNVAELRPALAEIYRVLAPGGRFVSIDMAVPPSKAARWISGVAFRKGVPMLGALFGKRDAYTYLPESTLQFASREEQADLMKVIGFKNVTWKNLFLGNICIHFGVK
ncbi:MAG: ubiquinone/menaquinone biosynthesis methyltransferase [Fimbriimonadales bacterium]|nr:ubiquinone/menaquinone biosynthesis methyltransferase [Fimbriimonadales bacterium]